MLALDGPEISDAAADIGPDILGNIGRDFQSTVIDRFLGSGDGVMNESAHLARFLLFDIVQRIETFYFAGEADRKLLSVEFLDIIRATLALHERGPRDLDRVAHGCNQAETGDDDATIQIQSSFCDKCEVRTLPAC